MDSYLVHYGVHGMRWGVHKSRGAGIKVSKQKEYTETENEPKGINVKKVAAKTIITAGKVIVSAKMASFMDDLFYDGIGKKLIKQTGRAFVTSYMKSKGSTNIHWYN